MIDIETLLKEKDCIIESMGYFNPLIIEEHNIVVTEGILGSIAETIKKLYEMIKGWIEKLIDFVASKFNRSQSSSKPTNITKQTDDRIKSVKQNLVNTEKKYQDAIKKSDIYKKMDEILKDDITQNKKTEDSDKNVEVPSLKDANKAISDIKRECETALKQKDPGNAVPKNEQLIRKYFIVGSNRKMKYSDLIKDKVYLSYTGDAGKECINQIKDYKKSLETEYTRIQNEAAKENNQENAQLLVKKAKGINIMTQKMLGTAIKCFIHYSDVVTKAMGKK